MQCLPDYSSAVDPLLVSLLKQVVPELAPYPTDLFNCSRALSYSVGRCKAAQLSLDAIDVKSYQPISNLLVLSKLLESLVAKLPESTQLFPFYQSVYGLNHLIEITVLHILYEHLTAAERGDLSARVFDPLLIRSKMTFCFSTWIFHVVSPNVHSSGFNRMCAFGRNNSV